ncbi:MAG: nucleotidyltransferase domain-containing protein [Armatimonadetes bacterium]|nr:nucleotidyltransferase domain-containing protein [Armatimonadota bacterium]
MPSLALAANDLALVRQILARHVAGTPVVAFGSRATGGARTWSDLDLMLLTQAPLSAPALADLREEFMESDLLISVDVIDASQADPKFVEAALRRSAPIM